MSTGGDPVVLADSVQFDLAHTDGGAPYRIFLRQPPGEPPAEGWPVLYLLDGNAMFATGVDAIRVQSAWPLATGIRDAVIVAIGYPTTKPHDSVRRSWDLSPPPGAIYPPHSPGGPDVRTGGAEAFLAFIEAELKPEIARRIEVDDRCQALFGHSFGGLFVLYALFNRPHAFTHWIAASPTIGWEDAVLLRSADAYERRDGRPPARVLLSAGVYEQTLAPFHLGAPDEDDRRAAQIRSRTFDNARAMAERLDALTEVDGAFVAIDGETHMSVLPTAVNQAIRFALGTWK